MEAEGRILPSLEVVAEREGRVIQRLVVRQVVTWAHETTRLQRLVYASSKKELACCCRIMFHRALQHAAWHAANRGGGIAWLRTRGPGKVILTEVAELAHLVVVRSRVLSRRVVRHLPPPTHALAPALLAVCVGCIYSVGWDVCGCHSQDRACKHAKWAAVQPQWGERSTKHDRVGSALETGIISSARPSQRGVAMINPTSSRKTDPFATGDPMSQTLLLT